MREATVQECSNELGALGEPSLLSFRPAREPWMFEVDAAEESLAHADALGDKHQAEQ